eukprot:TRINITY_DN12682_c0_g6_i1.p1 TRINITY_DN12682_c0_g6~~TRINITY_DN12682_c0_g6_i1.p1  ORF type:complete len:422 (+),score=44.16 TRINITY_DN12682_c0_g6_i1:102-1268(+)
MCIRDRSTWGLVINVMMPRVSEAPVSAENASPSQSLSSSPYATVRKSSIKDYQIDTIFFNRLLRLEEKLFRRTYTLETISDLVTLYSQAVEYYDAKKDPSKQYYLEKIQFTLTNEEIFRVLLSNIRKNSNSRNEIGSSPGNTNLSLPESEEDEMDSDKEEFKMRESPAMRRLSTKDVSSGAKSRLTTMRMSLILKLERSKSSEKNDMKNIVTDFEKNQKVNDDVVKVNLENQVDNFKARHAKKRKMNQAKKSHSRNASSTSNLFANIDRGSPASFFEILSHLNVLHATQLHQDYPLKTIGVGRSERELMQSQLQGCTLTLPTSVHLMCPIRTSREKLLLLIHLMEMKIHPCRLSGNRLNQQKMLMITELFVSTAVSLYRNVLSNNYLS